jgi:hypothetical protein
MTPLPRNRWQRKSRLASEKARKMGLASQKVQRERREAEMPERIRELAEIEIQNLPRKQGDALGSLQWTDFRTGKVRRWTFRIGSRADQVTMHSPDGRGTQSHGWTWVMNNLRGYLAGRRV